MPASQGNDETIATGERLHRLAVYVLRVIRSEHSTAGISIARLSALSAIAEFGPISVGDLALRERVRSPTIVQVVRELERRASVTTENDPSDKRVTLVRVTDAGLAELAEDRARVGRAIESALRTGPPADEKSLRRCIDTLCQALRPPDP